jgi:ribonuclease P protein component
MERLRRSGDFSRVLRTGRSFANHRAVLYVLGRGDQAPARVGFVTSRRLGNAVVRNRVRRLLREAVRECGAEVPAGLDLVWIGRSGSVGAREPDVAASVRELMERAFGRPDRRGSC